MDVSGPNPLLKLVDFGDCVRQREMQEISPPANVEFASPECVLGQPAGPPADLWSCAVFLYLFLRYEILFYRSPPRATSGKVVQTFLSLFSVGCRHSWMTV